MKILIKEGNRCNYRGSIGGMNPREVDSFMYCIIRDKNSSDLLQKVYEIRSSPVDDNARVLIDTGRILSKFHDESDVMVIDFKRNK